MAGASTELPNTEIALQISAEVQFFEPPNEQLVRSVASGTSVWVQ